MKHYDLDVVLFCAGMPIAGDTIPCGKAIGGSETAAIQVAEAMARQGHHVTIFCNTEKASEAGGVHYSPIGWIKGQNNSLFPKGFLDFTRSTPIDLLVVQRQPSVLSFEFQSKVNFLWQHDLATKTGPSRFHTVMWNLDRILVLSEFMRKQYQLVHAGPDRLYEVTRNGIDINLIDQASSGPRDRFCLTYNARPERGLEVLLGRVFPEILKREPRAKLFLSRYADPSILPLYQELEQLASKFGDKVINLNNLGKRELYEHYKRTRLYLYPSEFEEVSCITVHETGACGTPFIGPWRGALPETCDGAHLLIKDDGGIGRKGDPIDPGFKGVGKEFIAAFADEVVSLMHDDERWERMSHQARKKAEQWTWDGVAAQWTGLARQIIEERCSDQRRMIKHFLVNSDVVAAEKFVAAHPNKQLKQSIDRYIEQHVPFMKEAEPKKSIGAFYEQRSGGDRASWQTAFWAETEQRLKVLIEVIREKREQGEKIETVLDFGCAHGGYARAISNAFPDIKVVGVDISPSLIRCANELKAAKLPDGSPACAHSGNLSFLTGDEDTDIYVTHEGQYLAGDHEDASTAQFDAVVCMEVLEHVPNSEEVANKLERHCRKDGWMMFTVPYGHRERDEFLSKGVPPVHVRSFDLHDLRDMFGARPHYTLVTFSDLKDLPWDGTFAGWFMATYQNDFGHIASIDWERKLSLQGPRETMAVCMITNNNEDILHRALRSVEKVADQIIVVDNGPSIDRTVELAKEYTPDVRAGTSPFYCYTHMIRHSPLDIRPNECEMAGFETPRNESIKNVWADWIWWMDSDEQLMNCHKLFKYLRPNVFSGYAVPQHHLSVDPPGALKQDIPVRLFRNSIGMKFYGLVHEHAEIGPHKGIGPDATVLGDIAISHDGYLTEQIRRGRFERNIRLLQCDRKRYPDRPLGIYLYEVRDNVHMARYALEKSGGRMTPEIQAYCWTVINTFRQHFMGNEISLARDGLNYYSDALGMLGLGEEFLIDMDVHKVAANFRGGAFRFRALNAEEAETIIGAKLRAMAAPFEGPYAS